jgi:hypothetical protein
MKSLGPVAISASRRRGCNNIMRISVHDALSFFAFMDPAELKLKHLGDKGKPFASKSYVPIVPVLESPLECKSRADGPGSSDATADRAELTPAVGRGKTDRMD